MHELIETNMMAEIAVKNMALLILTTNQILNLMEHVSNAYLFFTFDKINEIMSKIYQKKSLLTK